MILKQQDVKRVSRKSEVVKGQVARHWVDVLQHVPTGITCLGQGNYRDSYYNALELLEKTVNAYYKAVRRISAMNPTDEMCAAIQLEMPVEGCASGECGCPYRTSCDTRNRMGEPQPFDGVQSHIIAFDEAPTLGEMIDKGWIDPLWGYHPTDRFNDLKVYEAETWLNEQPDHSAISKGPVPDGMLWALLAAHTVCVAPDGIRYIDFGSLKRFICDEYNVKPY